MTKFRVVIELDSEKASVQVYGDDKFLGTLDVPRDMVQDFEELFRVPHLLQQNVGVVGKGATVTGITIGRLG